MRYTVRMAWYPYGAYFFAGVFLANAVPHFVQGVSGNAFPSPFATPPGKGLSSPTVNVVWALFNLGVGYLLLQLGHTDLGGPLSFMMFFLGATATSIMSSINFQYKEKE